MSDVNLVARLAHREGAGPGETTRLGEDGLEVCQRLARLGDNVTRVQRDVPDDARRAGNEEHTGAVRGIKRRAREGRAMRPVLRRVVIGAHLPRVLDRARAPACCHEVHGELAAGIDAQRAGGGDRRRAQPPGRLECRAAADVEEPVSLDAALVLVDAREVVPEAHDVREPVPPEHCEDVAIGALGEIAKGERRLRKGDDAEDDIAGDRVPDGAVDAPLHRSLRYPYLAEGRRPVAGPQARGGHARGRHVGRALPRQVREAQHAEESGARVLQVVRGDIERKVFDVKHVVSILSRRRAAESPQWEVE